MFKFREWRRRRQIEKNIAELQLRLGQMASDETVALMIKKEWEESDPVVISMIRQWRPIYDNIVEMNRRAVLDHIRYWRGELKKLEA